MGKPIFYLKKRKKAYLAFLVTLLRFIGLVFLRVVAFLATFLRVVFFLVAAFFFRATISLSFIKDSNN